MKNLTSDGFSLVEVMVGVGMLSLAALAAGQLIGLINQSTAYSDRTSEFASLQDSLQQVINYQDMCTSAIGVGSGLNQSINLINLTAGTQQLSIKSSISRSGVVAQNQFMINSQLKVDSLTLANVRNYSGQQYVAQVKIIAEDLKGFVFRPVVIGTIRFVLNGNSIANCIGMSSGITEDICNQMSCNWNAGGSPQCQCKVFNSFCGAGEYLSNITGGQATCVLLTQNCGAGYLQGFDLNGPICAALPP